MSFLFIMAFLWVQDQLVVNWNSDKNLQSYLLRTQRTEFKTIIAAEELQKHRWEAPNSAYELNYLADSWTLHMWSRFKAVIAKAYRFRVSSYCPLKKIESRVKFSQYSSEEQKRNQIICKTSFTILKRKGKQWRPKC